VDETTLENNGTHQNTKIPNIRRHLPSITQDHLWRPIVVWLNGPNAPVVVFLESGCQAKVDKLWYTSQAYERPEVITGLIHWSSRGINLASHRFFKLRIYEISKHGWILE
jgi:hypothetical protein